jgi:hypothetical protein
MIFWGCFRQSLQEGKEVDPGSALSQAVNERLWILREIIFVTIEARDPNQPSLNFDVFAT